MLVTPNWEDERRYDEPDTIEDADLDSRRRTGGERDRDRVMYSTAFQRLAGITQVVPIGLGDGVHSRLTHSLKVAQVARRLAQRIVQHDPDLKRELDPDSVEAAALAHDLGHPPFGHIAEEELNRFAEDHGCDGFEGNAQSFRLVTRLSQRWPTVDGEEMGLNLTRRTLDGLLKYPWLMDADDPNRARKWGAYRADEAAFVWVRKRRTGADRSPAAIVMDWADDLTYAVHDMEDFFRAGLIPVNRLCSSDTERERFTDSFSGTDGKLNERLTKFSRPALVRAVDRVFDLLDFLEPYNGDRVQRQLLRMRSSTLIREYMHSLHVGAGLLKVDADHEMEVAILKELTWFYVIDRQDLATVQEGQRRLIRGLCEGFLDAAAQDRPYLFPALEQEALQQARTPAAEVRVVCDFVGRLTEARATELHRRLIGVSVPALVRHSH